MSTTMTKERPILFSGPMVRAILEGRKTQTRRVVKPPAEQGRDRDGEACGPMVYDLSRATADHGFPTDDTGEVLPMHRWSKGSDPAPESMYRNHYLHVPFKHPHDSWSAKGDDPRARVYAPWAAGDRLFVRESWGIIQPTHGTGRGTNMDPWFVYRADAEKPSWEGGTFEFSGWRPSIHMPRKASRLTLEIECVRVERVQDISEADAIAEGLPHQDGNADEPRACWLWRGRGYHGAGFDTHGGRTYHTPSGQDGRGRCNCAVGGPTPAQCAYRELWDSINGEGSWNANPWVWVLDFRRVDA